jgi:16S rRNA U1498 N3-methylase RsmE
MNDGDTVRCGIVDFGMTDNACIGKIERSPKGVLNSITLHLGSGFHCGRRPTVDLILALPRPQKLKRLLPIISSLGVDNIYLIGAKKVEKDYFGK